MTKVTDPFAASPQLMKQWMGASLAVEQGLEKSLVELVKIRASILNGCANCINMHTVDARAHGESEQRIYLLAAWQEAPVYTPRERAALAWTEAVTLVAASRVPDTVYLEAREHFDERALGDLTLVVATINAWNRLAIAARDVPGAYRSHLTARTEPTRALSPST